MTTMSASEVFVLVDDRKTPPVQVAGDEHHECKLHICTSWWLENIPPVQDAEG